MGEEEAERLDLLLGTLLRHVTALAERPAEEGRLPGTERRQEALGSNLGRVGGRFKTWRPPPFSSSVVPLAPLLKFLCSKEGSGEGGEAAAAWLQNLRASSGGCTSPSCSSPRPRSGSWCGISSGLL